MGLTFSRGDCDMKICLLGSNKWRSFFIHVGYLFSISFVKDAINFFVVVFKRQMDVLDEHIFQRDGNFIVFGISFDFFGDECAYI